MVSIVLLGEKHPRRFFNFLKEKLESFGGVLVLDENELATSAEKPKYLICHSKTVEKINISNSVIIPMDAQCLASIKFIKPGSVFLLDSSLDFAGAPTFENIKVISCGFKGTDSLTLSSFTEESAVVNLQRGVYNFLGQAESSSEFPFTLTEKYDYFYILTLFAVMLISGQNEFFEQLKI